MTGTTYCKIIRTGGIYDFVSTAAFATPWTFVIIMRFLGRFDALPDFGPLHLLFANLMGSLVILWALLRIRDPRPVYGLYDSGSRFLFFTWELYYLIAMHGTPIVWFFVFFEILFGAIEGYGYWHLRKSEPELLAD
jgi:hypothetical protein